MGFCVAYSKYALKLAIVFLTSYVKLLHLLAVNEQIGEENWQTLHTINTAHVTS